MSFTDTIKKSVLESFQSDVTVWRILLGLSAALAAALFILFIYRVTMRGIAFNRGYEITLLLTTSISAMIVLTITSNLALSLGMVGALSIVRFRTAIKESSDTAFLFWGVAAGITSGAGFYQITLIGCLFIGLVALLATRVCKNASRPYLLVIRAVPAKEGGANANALAEKVLGDNKVRSRLASLVQNERYTEIVYEISASEAQQRILAALDSLPGVTSVSLVDCRNS